MSKDDLIKKCDELGIKYQENDTKEQLELMIKGKESDAVIAELKSSHQGELESKINALNELHKEELKAKDAYCEECCDKLNAQAAELVNKLSEKETELEELKGLNEKLQESNEMLEAKSDKKLTTAKVDGKTYVIKSGLRTGDGIVIPKNELAKDKETLKDLIKSGSGIVVELKKK